MFRFGQKELDPLPLEKTGDGHQEPTTIHYPLRYKRLDIVKGLDLGMSQPVVNKRSRNHLINQRVETMDRFQHPASDIKHYIDYMAWALLTITLGCLTRG